MKKVIKLFIAIILGLFFGFLSFLTVNMIGAMTIGRFCLDHFRGLTVIPFCDTPFANIIVGSLSVSGPILIILFMILFYKLLGKYIK